MYLAILTILSALTLFAITVIILASKLVRGANAEQIAKGKATKSRDELRREIRIVRVVMLAVILICVAIGVVITFL
jgi:ABC-type Fe3+ transport system permease subunit